MPRKKSGLNDSAFDGVNFDNPPYVCPRCTYSTPKVASIKSHLKKEKPCKNIIYEFLCDCLEGFDDLAELTFHQKRCAFFKRKEVLVKKMQDKYIKDKNITDTLNRNITNNTNITNIPFDKPQSCTRSNKLTNVKKHKDPKKINERENEPDIEYDDISDSNDDISDSSSSFNELIKTSKKKCLKSNCSDESSMTSESSSETSQRVFKKNYQNQNLMIPEKRHIKTYSHPSWLFI